MIGNRKVLGICLAKLQDRTRAEYLNNIQDVMSAQGWKLLVFSSFNDFYRDDSYSRGAMAVYSIINYDVVDVFLIFAESFSNDEIVRNLIEKAREHGKPVITLGKTYEGAFSIIRDYEEAYKTVVRHVICHHGITDTFFIGGRSEGEDEATALRLKYYREVLEENDIPFDENRVAYGEYWDDPTDDVVSTLVADGKKPPRAIICVNDYTAVTVCEKLAILGYKVPDDCIVTGFDGVPAAYYYNPSITSCSDVPRKLGEVVFEATEKAYSGDEPSVFYDPFSPRIRRSCGCDLRRSGLHDRRADMTAGFMSSPVNSDDKARTYAPYYVSANTAAIPDANTAAMSGATGANNAGGPAGNGISGRITQQIPGNENLHTGNSATSNRRLSIHNSRLIEGRYPIGNILPYMYRELDSIETHEDITYGWLDRMLEITEISTLYEELGKGIIDDSYILVNSDFIDPMFDVDKRENNGFTEELTVIPSENLQKSVNTLETLNIRDMAPGLTADGTDGRMYIFNSIFVGDILCGYYVMATYEAEALKSRTKRIIKIINIVFRSLLNRNRQKHMLQNIADSIYKSSMTGLPNLKGATKWFEEFSQNPDNHRRTLTVSVYSMPRYTFIYENYGMYEIEESVRFVADALLEANKRNCYVAYISEGEFIVINYYRDAREISDVIKHSTSRFFSRVENRNNTTDKEYLIEVNAGFVEVGCGWDGSLESYVRMAVSDLYLNRLQSGAGEVVKDKTIDREYFNTFELLLERNLFKYHFQPIVDAHNGDIIAYEALMRTSGGISMSPLDVLSIAKDLKRLYDIEKATMFNIMGFYSQNIEKFDKKKVFINTIPGYFLNEKDQQELRARYSEYLDSFVYEITEQNTIADEELESLKSLCNSEKQAHLAVDDYGTGHSNIVNLLRYSPNVIKIDRYLISEIQNDMNKQMFVKNTIEFAALNGIKVLAEGVETSEELQKVIEYGVDYIQGYYTARPAADPIPALPDVIRNEIVATNLKLSRFDNNMQVYNAVSGETIRLLDLALKKFTYINVSNGVVRLVGEKDNMIDMVITTADNSHTTLIFENVNIKGASETTVQLGRNSNTTITIIGENTLNKEGIRCSEGSSLRVVGDGNLTILNSRNFSVGIGANCNDPYGDMTFDLTGTIKIISNGDKVVCIGGARSSCSKIRLLGGKYDLNAKGMAAVALGSTAGDCDIYIGDAECRFKSDGNDSVGLGAIDGWANIECTGSRFEVIGDGERTVGIGTIKGKSQLSMREVTINSNQHSYSGIGIGSLNDESDIKLTACKLEIYGEGTQIGGVGSYSGSGRTVIDEGSMNIEILAGVPLELGSDMTHTFLNKGRIFVARDNNAKAITATGDMVEPEYVNGGKMFLQ